MDIQDAKDPEKLGTAYASMQEAAYPSLSDDSLGSPLSIHQSLQQVGDMKAAASVDLFRGEGAGLL